MHSVRLSFVLACVTAAAVLGQSLPQPPPTKVILCHMPGFYDKFDCGKNPAAVANIADLIMLDVSKMPFNPEQWLHVDVIPTDFALSTGKALQIKEAMIQISDSKDRIIGRVAEHVPCEDTGHPMYLTGTGEIVQLYRNPGAKNMSVIECEVHDEVNFNSPPTVGVFSFSPPHYVQSFYVNFKLTKEEADFVLDQTKSERIFITTMLVDTAGSCYLHRVVQLQGVYANSQSYVIPPVEVPVRCHHFGPAFRMENNQPRPLLMVQGVNWEDVEFPETMDLGIRPRNSIPHIIKPEWREDVGNYNLKVMGLDEEGLTAAERIAEANKDDTEKRNSLRNSGLPLVIIDELAEEEEVGVNLRKFDFDDKECNDSLRTKKPENVNDDMTRIYLDCVYSRMCVGEPEGCMEDRNCEFVLSWGKQEDYVVFEVLAERMTYVAVGLSKDDQMGDDSVTECIRENNGVAGYTSWNFKNEQNELGNIRLRSCESMKDFRGILLLGSNIFCSWKRPIVTRVKGYTFDMNEPYHILTARGHISEEGVYGNIAKHEISTIATREAAVFNRYLGKSPLQFWIARIHGITMLVVWMLIVPVATFAPRYLKGTFFTERIYGYSVWYGLHFILVTTAIVFTLASTVVLPITNSYERAKGESRHSLHSALGLAISIMVLLQVGLAQLVLDGQWKYIKYLHGMVGHSAMICGHACIITSRGIKDGMPCNIIVSYTLYLLSGFILHSIMSYQICFSDFVRGRASSRVYKIFLIDEDKEYDLPRRPRRRKTATLQAELERKRRLTLDEIGNVEDGAIINPHLRESMVQIDPAFKREIEKEEEEPGAAMRRIVFVIFLWVAGLFTLYYVILMLLPNYYLDCPSMEMLKPGKHFTPGYLYF